MKLHPLSVLLTGGLIVAGVALPGQRGAWAAAPGVPADSAVGRARQEVLVAAVGKRFVSDAVKVSDAEVEAFFEAHRAEFAGSERIVLRHLFRRLSVQAPASAREAARAELEGLRREISAGADLATLAKARSDSQSARFGGLIAPQARGQLESSIETRVWRLEVGELSEVVETPIGFHIFRLEQRLPPQDIPADTARAVSRQKLTLAATAAARERLFEELLRESGAFWAPQLYRRGLPPATRLFELGATRWTAGDLERWWTERTFRERRTTSPLALLRERAERALSLFKAEKERLDADPGVALALAQAEAAARLEAAVAARAAERRARLAESDLRPLFEARPGRFALPARYRLRILVRAFSPEHSPNRYFEELSALAIEIRGGRRDFADAARELSTDPSAAEGGDLGWIDLRDLGWWAGTTVYERVRSLAPGVLTEPLLVEVYDPAQLKDLAHGYMLVRVEGIEPSRQQTFVEAREEVAAAWIEDHLAELRREVEGANGAPTLPQP